MNVNYLYIVLGVAVLVLVLLRIHGRRTHRMEGFGSGGGGKELLIVKAKWCGHCQRAMPEFEKLVAASPIRVPNGSSVTVRMLDERDDKAEVEPLSVRGFPTIIFRDGDSRMEYNGERTYEGVMGFLQHTAPSS